MSGTERLMGDQAFEKRAHMLHTAFDHGCPRSSVASTDAFKALINQKGV